MVVLNRKLAVIAAASVAVAGLTGCGGGGHAAAVACVPLDGTNVGHRLTLQEQQAVMLDGIALARARADAGGSYSGTNGSVDVRSDDLRDRVASLAGNTPTCTA